MKVSIVTITYNRAHLIAETIRSVLAQTYGNFEHIIIDDGSTDDTPAVVSQFNDDRIKYYKYEKNGRRSFLRNEGIRKSGGDFISILDSDDLWNAGKLEKMVKIFTENPEVGFVFHNIAFIPENSVRETAYRFASDEKGNFLPDLLNGEILPFPVLTMKRSLLDKIGLIDESLTDGQHDLYLRAAANGIGFYCAEKLIAMRKHGQNISKNYQLSHYDDYFLALEKLESNRIISHARCQTVKSRLHYKTAYIYLRQKQYGAAKEKYWMSFRTKPSHGLKPLAMYLRTSLFFNR